MHWPVSATGPASSAAATLPSDTPPSGGCGTHEPGVAALLHRSEQQQPSARRRERLRLGRERFPQAGRDGRGGLQWRSAGRLLRAEPARALENRQRVTIGRDGERVADLTGGVGVHSPHQRAHVGGGQAAQVKPVVSIEQCRRVAPRGDQCRDCFAT